MAATPAGLRVRLADLPKQNVSPGGFEVIGVGDGTNTVFQMRIDHPNLVPASLLVYAQTVGSPAFSQTSAYTFNPTTMQITMNAAPAAQTTVAVLYQWTAFADSDLQTYLDEAVGWGATTDEMTYKKALYDTLGYLLNDRDKLAILHAGDYSKDPNAVMAQIQANRKALLDELLGKLTPNQNLPTAIMTAPRVDLYTPKR